MGKRAPVLRVRFITERSLTPTPFEGDKCHRTLRVELGIGSELQVTFQAKSKGCEDKVGCPSSLEPLHF